MQKQEILKKLGRDHTTPCVFDKDWNFAEAIYTYKNDIYCLYEGRDFEFNDLTDHQKNIIHREIMGNNYILDETFQ
jgi:hypothetical protein